MIFKALGTSVACLLAVTMTARSSAQSTPWEKMDYGPFLSTTVELESGNIAYKGMPSPSVRHRWTATMLFDMDLLRWAGGWRGQGWISGASCTTVRMEFIRALTSLTGVRIRGRAHRPRASSSTSDPGVMARSMSATVDGTDCVSMVIRWRSPIVWVRPKFCKRPGASSSTVSSPIREHFRSRDPTRISF